MTEWKLPPAPRPNNDHPDVPSLVGLGRTLFFDERLSKNNDRSCASCHIPELSWSDALPTAISIKGESLTRATPSLINSAYGTIFNWDGRANSLEQHAMLPILNPEEMGMDLQQLLALLKADAFYKRTFAELFPEEAIDETHVGVAIAAFERTLIARDTPFDQWIDGNTEALSMSEKRGFGIFLDKKRGKCAQCHHAPNFTDEGFHNIGVNSITNDNSDLGRYNIRPVEVLRGAFKTPTLRNIALTAPYFHDGSAKTLEDVVLNYTQGGTFKDNLSPEMKEIELSVLENNDLIAFLKALTQSSNNSEVESYSEVAD